ncbi:MAG: NAD(P)H-hydrate epimerase [Chloroflexi bacterium]|nr:NAD(P)H-hydrate epimerase [Chloroflexota bacterium]
MELPYLSVEQMRTVDRLMVDSYGVSSLQMMESASRHLARLTCTLFFGDDPRGKRISVLAGAGGSGGAGLSAARRLLGWGGEVDIWLSSLREQYTGAADRQLRSLEMMQARVRGPEIEPRYEANVILDALIGYSLHGSPKGRAAQLIRAANSHGAPILALDVPSGVDADSGDVHDPAIKAAATLTLALPKRGLKNREARPYVGELYVGDLSVPPSLYERPEIGVKVGPIFATEEIIRVW